MRYAINNQKFLADSEVEQLLTILKRSPVRDRCLFETLLYSGARASEVLNLTVSDLNHEGKSVLIKGLKNSNDREIPLPNELFARLIKLNQEGKVFNITYSRLQQLWQFYRPVKKKLHSLRHTAAIRWYLKTRDLRVVQVALGHRSINNTLVYAQYLFEQKELRKLLL